MTLGHPDSWFPQWSATRLEGNWNLKATWRSVIHGLYMGRQLEIKMDELISTASGTVYSDEVRNKLLEADFHQLPWHVNGAVSLARGPSRPHLFQVLTSNYVGRTWIYIVTGILESLPIICFHFPLSSPLRFLAPSSWFLCMSGPSLIYILKGSPSERYAFYVL